MFSDEKLGKTGFLWLIGSWSIAQIWYWLTCARDVAAGSAVVHADTHGNYADHDTLCSLNHKGKRDGYAWLMRRSMVGLLATVGAAMTAFGTLLHGLFVCGRNLCWRSCHRSSHLPELRQH